MFSNILSHFSELYKRAKDTAGRNKQICLISKMSDNNNSPHKVFLTKLCSKC